MDRKTWIGQERPACCDLADAWEPPCAQLSGLAYRRARFSMKVWALRRRQCQHDPDLFLTIIVALGLAVLFVCADRPHGVGPLHQRQPQAVG